MEGSDKLTRLKRRRKQTAAGGAAALLLLACCTACELPPGSDAQTDSPPPTEPSSSDSPPTPDDTLETLAASDRTITVASGQGVSTSSLGGPTRKSLVIAVLHVQVAEKHAAAMDRIWNQLREDVLDADTQFRLRENGFRAGVGHIDFWASLKEEMDAIPERRVITTTPVRVPLGFPISLELDSEPRDQTLFIVGRDGILSGTTLPESRNVLRVAYAADPQHVGQIRLAARPESHRKEEGFKWVRTEEGIWQVPRQNVTTFDAAEFVLSLKPDQFVLIATSDSAHVYGIIGRAFLTAESEGTRYRSYVFLRPDVTDVGQRG